MSSDPNVPTTIHVNINHRLFSSKSPKDFALLLGSLPHEMQHGQQARRLMANRAFGHDSDVYPKGKQEVLLHTPSVGAINLSTKTLPHNSQFGYVAQPLELQGHLLHHAAYKAMLKILPSSSGTR